MSTGTVLPAATAPPTRTPTKAVESSATWRPLDRLGLALCWILGVGFCVITAAIVLYLLVQGLRYVTPELVFTRPTAGFTEAQTGGFLDPLLGTLLVTTMGMAIALPVGIGIAIWLSEYGRPAALARIADSTIETIAGAPSVVLALFGTLIFTSPALGFLSRTSDGVVYGRSFFGAAAMLSFVALPLIVTSTREGLAAIPAHVREASYAVGKTKIATTRRILLPTARPSVITGAMLGAGRIVGDTAIIVLLLGATLQFNGSGDIPLLNTLKGTGSTLTSYVYQNSPTGEGNNPTKAYAAAFVLLLIVLVLNLGVELVNRRSKATTWAL